MNYKHYLLGGTILLIGILGYHYYAASEAADQIDEALQEQSRNVEGSFSITYSDINVHPFSGDIEFQDMSVTQKDYSYETSLLNFDQTYLDFLRFYIGGTEYGLKKIRYSIITFINPAAEVQSIARKITADTLTIDYEGNLYDLIRHAVNKQPVEHTHHLNAKARAANLTEPGSSWGSFSLDSVTVETRLPAKTNSLLNADRMVAKANSIQWTPPSYFQKKYEFFIRGFGYQPDSVAIDSVKVQVRPGEQVNEKVLNGDLHADLFHLRAGTDLIIYPQTPDKSVFRNGTISIPEISESFNTFLQNSEQLFGISIPQRRINILKFDGPVTNPRFSIGGRAKQ